MSMDEGGRIVEKGVKVSEKSAVLSRQRMSVWVFFDLTWRGQLWGMGNQKALPFVLAADYAPLESGAPVAAMGIVPIGFPLNMDAAVTASQRQPCSKFQHIAT